MLRGDVLALDAPPIVAQERFRVPPQLHAQYRGIVA
jgi:hypothetical protein